MGARANRRRVDPLPCWGDVWGDVQAPCEVAASWSVIGPDRLDDGQVVIVVAGACDRHMLSTRLRLSTLEPAAVVDARWYLENRAQVEADAGGQLWEARRAA